MSEKKPRDFEIPIKLHTRPLNGIVDPTHTQFDTPFVSRGKVYTSWSYATQDDTTSGSSAAAPISVDEPAPPPQVQDVQPPRKKNKRKFEAINPNELPDSMFGGTLKPKSTPSFLALASTTVTTSTGEKVSYGTAWTREIVDNNRSDKPSDREVALEKIKEEARAKARAEAAAAKKNKKPGPKRRASNNVTASASRNTSPAPDLETPSTVTPIIAFAPPNGMKRTRSAGGGVGPISAVLANALGTGSVNVSSPLKVVQTRQRK
jgi:hypothetical protein